MMNNAIQRLTALMLAALIINACNDDTLGPQHQLSFDVFPNAVGAWWEYQRFDSLTSTVDTIRVEITDTTTLPNGELAKIWVSTVAGAIIDTVHVSIVTSAAGDSVKIYDLAVFTTPQMLYALPFEVGATWVNVEAASNNCQYDFTVMGVETVETPLAVYPTAFSVWRADMTNNCFAVSDYFVRRRVWLVDGLGMVQYWRYTNDIQTPSPRSNETWTLIDFDVTPSL